MGKYCCFCCPAADYAEKSLDDLCPTCRRAYGFPLTNRPTEIKDYRVVRSLGRGFYAATFVAERGALGIRSVLKVSPKAFYEFFPNKDFETECRIHHTVAEGTEHIVGIRDMFDGDVNFGDVVVSCYVAELEYVDGDLLAEYLKPGARLTATAAAQIAVDLLKIRDALQKKNVNHNDLHAENIIIESLDPNAARVAEIEGTIRAVAIDLGSVSTGSRSDSEKLRQGDLHWIASHLNSIVEKLIGDPDEISDLDNRLASELHGIAQSISSQAENQRTPAPLDFIGKIEEAYYHATQPWRPWREPLKLMSFNASYNAQTMHPWHVPHLLVDPEGQWVNSICSPGPQVITGMRGCGKTMLLRALQFHARATQSHSESNTEVLERLKNDRYIGLFVSAQRLLDTLGEKTQVELDPFPRLFVAYALEAVRAINHLEDIDRSYVSERAYRYLAEVVAASLEHAEDVLSSISMSDLEKHLIRLQISISRRERDYQLTEHPNIAFSSLSEAIRRCSRIWKTAQVLFLLDDVSTRYLKKPRIKALLSALLFQSPSCAFKLTSEVQTIELGLESPGERHPIRVGRDLIVFDLGAKVYEKIKKRGKGNGRDFVEEILSQRASYFTAHPESTPSELLGDVPLETIATEIGTSPKESRRRKEIYRGITALAHVCVGDIGDVISLYQQILKSGEGQPIPYESKIQSECFQDFCARRLYDLNRRGGLLMDAAKSFAEASYELLVQSFKKPLRDHDKRRIRQYSSLYVRITTGDFEQQTERLRDLIDAGVFVFAGGSNVPRTKTRDSNPTQQFKLAYRKIYGIVNFIGLADRDRYELSGEDLEQWLKDPSNGKDILLRNLIQIDPPDEAKEDTETHDRVTVQSDSKNKPASKQISLFENGATFLPSDLEESRDNGSNETTLPRGIEPVVQKLNGTFPDEVFDWAIIGLGFEDRTYESARRIFSSATPRNGLLIEYNEPGRSEDIQSILDESRIESSTVHYREVVDQGLRALEGNTIVDITGLAKPVIFHAVRNALRSKKHVWICHTQARRYYPLDVDLEKIFEGDGSDRHDQLANLSEVLTGEQGPYQCAKLLSPDSDNTRQRVLCAFSSPKHERLLSLLDSRDYDRLEIVAPGNDTNRSKAAKIVAEVAARNNPNSGVTEIESNDIFAVLAFITKMYGFWYIDRRFNFEFGLTGSKLQTVACAAASAAFKVSQCWYLQPADFDPLRFTQGVGETHFYRISLNES